jgi:hypothetical protein
MLGEVAYIVNTNLERARITDNARNVKTSCSSGLNLGPTTANVSPWVTRSDCDRGPLTRKSNHDSKLECFETSLYIVLVISHSEFEENAIPRMPSLTYRTSKRLTWHQVNHKMQKNPPYVSIE